MMKTDGIPQIDAMYPVWEGHTLWTRFEQSCRRFSEKEFLIFESGTRTFAQTYEQVRRTAKALLAAGVRPGDHVALLLHNCPEFIYLTFALAAVGAVKVPINAGINGEELGYVLEHTDVRILFSEKQLPEETFQGLEKFQSVILTNCRNAAEQAPVWERFLAGAEGVSDETLEERTRMCRDPYALSDIMYTSGSTSKPKGVMISHDMLLRSSYATCRCRFMEEGRRIFVPVPLFHLMAYNEALLPAVYMGGTLIMSERRYDPLHCLELMKEHGANDIVCVSSIMMDLLTKGQPKPEEFPAMRHAYWASACPDWVWQAGREAFGVEDVTTAYGMTECGSTTTMVSAADPEDFVRHCHGRRKNAGAAGLAEYDGNLLEVSIRGEDGNALPAGECGEIWCRGAVVTKGYYRNDEANARAFTKDGWFKSGDLGRLDEDGVLTYMGRNSDMYKINGENVSPQFLDSVIGTCPQVKAVETVGIKHPKYGEIGVAFVDAADETEQTKAAIQQYCKEHLAKFQVPKHFIFSDSSGWPKTGSGKVKKAALREIAAERLESQCTDFLCDCKSHKVPCSFNQQDKCPAN